MKPKIYIDGKEGTTGLQIYQRLGDRNDIELLLIDEDKRKDVEERKKFLNSADIVFLCLPDAASKEAVTLIDNPNVRVIDASSAHRVNPDWTYGFAELNDTQKDKIKIATRVTNPGCHASGFVSVVAPLTQNGILPKDCAVNCFSVTGYSGGGKSMIADYENENRDISLDAPRNYGLTLHHKHIPEMQKYANLEHAPVFTPIVSGYYKGMSTTVQLQNRLLVGNPTAEQIHEILSNHYNTDGMVHVAPFGSESSMISANELAGYDYLKIFVCGHDEQTTITALFDNLGKGASGSAVQNMNLMLGFDEKTGLTL